MSNNKENDTGSGIFTGIKPNAKIVLETITDFEFNKERHSKLNKFVLGKLGEGKGFYIRRN